MSKDKLKQKENVGVAAHSDPNFEGITKNKKGITLIALIITIIVMLILVGVSVTVTLKGGLFKTAQDAANNTRAERDNELNYLTTEVGKWAPGAENGSGTETKDWTIEGELKIGSLITHTSGEKFYVIGGEKVGTEVTSNASKVILLAEHCVVANKESEDYLKQSEEAEPVIFSDESYWASVTDETEYPLNLNEYPIPEGVTSIIKTAKEYGDKFKTNGITGRLLTLEELKDLGGDLENWVSGDCPDYVNSTFYWLGSALYSDYTGNESVYTLNGPGIMIMGFEISQAEYIHFRPVIEIPKDLIK